MSTYTHIVQFDVTYIDGNLANILIPGEMIRCTSLSEADHLKAWYDKQEREGSAIYAYGTGNSYKVSNAAVFKL